MGKFKFNVDQQEKAKECLLEFADRINDKDWGGAEKLCGKTWRVARPKASRHLERMFFDYGMKGIKITSVRVKEGVLLVEILFIDDRGKWKINLIPEVQAYRADPKGAWGVVPTSLAVRK
jgi:hypothetical protein